ncbi:MAG: DUF255 domain-containing protein [Balneolaceae bacterium]|nr:MAG: DUF255 domain-containing protein [Balneolaceae bacterium]
MKFKILLSAALLTFFGSGALCAQNQDPVSVPLEEALETAAESGKKILLDVYVEWCPYCQRMHGETYTDNEVLKAISEHFLWVRINAESEQKVNYLGTELSMIHFAQALENRSFPTTYFMNQEGNIIAVQPGYLDSGIFADILNFVGSDAYLQMDFESFQNLN